jgi:hypothetical protein
MIVLTSELVDAIHIERSDRMFLIDGQIEWSAVNLARAREHDPHSVVVSPTRLQD